MLRHNNSPKYRWGCAHVASLDMTFAEPTRTHYADGVAGDTNHYNLHHAFLANTLPSTDDFGQMRRLLSAAPYKLCPIGIAIYLYRMILVIRRGLMDSS